MILYILGIIVLIYIQIICFQKYKENQSIKNNVEIKKTVLLNEIESNSLIPLRKTVKKLIICIGFDYNIQFKRLSNSECIKYFETSITKLNSSNAYYLLNDDKAKEKLYLLIKHFHEINKFESDEEGLVFLWICSISSWAYTPLKNFEKIILLGNQVMYENDFLKLFQKYNKTKFITGFQSNITFLPKLQIMSKHVKESPPDKLLFTEQMQDYSYIIPFDKFWIQPESKKIKLDFHEVTDILDKVWEWEANEKGYPTNTFVWCLHGLNLVENFISFLEILGYDVNIENFVSYLNDEGIQQSFGKLYKSKTKFESLF